MRKLKVLMVGERFYISTKIFHTSCYGICLVVLRVYITASCLFLTFYLLDFKASSNGNDPLKPDLFAYLTDIILNVYGVCY